MREDGTRVGRTTVGRMTVGQTRVGRTRVVRAVRVQRTIRLGNGDR